MTHLILALALLATSGQADDMPPERLNGKYLLDSGSYRQAFFRREQIKPDWGNVYCYVRVEIAYDEDRNMLVFRQENPTWRDVSYYEDINAEAERGGGIYERAYFDKRGFVFRSDYFFRPSNWGKYTVKFKEERDGTFIKEYRDYNPTFGFVVADCKYRKIDA